MIKQMKNLSDLKDSHLLYDKNPPPLSLYMIITVTVTLVIIVIWSIYTPKTYVVKSNGAVVSETRNYIMSEFTGEIIEANVTLGSYIEKGDILFQISSTDLDMQEERTRGLILVNQEKILQYERLEDYIKNGINMFDENIEDDKQYYYIYETYASQIGQLDKDVSTLKMFNYTDEQIENEIRTNEAAIAEVYYTTLKTISDSIQSLRTEIANYELQLSSIVSGQATYPIVASTSGIVHMDTEFRLGMVIQAGVVIGSIVNENDVYYVRVYTTTNDMPLIRMGNHVDIAVDGLAQSIYGTIDGTISFIASEVTIDNENGSSAFIVNVSLDSVYLISSLGNKVNLSNGMTVEARIQYDELTYFNYFLESLGMLTR